MRAIAKNHAYSLLILIFLMLCSCGSHPTDLASDRDIKRASADETRIRIGLLPIEYYPKLAKFHKVTHVDFFTMDGSGADDERLRTLSRVDLPSLWFISCSNCPKVTDSGMQHLAEIKSLRSLNMEGTSITDNGLILLSSSLALEGINFTNVSSVSIDGIMHLLKSGKLERIGFSLGDMDYEDVEKIIKASASLNRIQIMDPTQRINEFKELQLRELAESKGIVLVIKTTGALQNLGIKASP